MSTLVRPLPKVSGGKAAVLLELKSAGFPVPDFFVSPSDLTEVVNRLGTPLVVRSSNHGQLGSCMAR